MASLKKTLLISALTLMAASQAVSAEELTGTLKKLKTDGTIVLGYRQSSVPWSYVDSNTNQVVGYSRDISMAILEAIKTQIGSPDLKLRDIPITAQNRISLIQNGTVDLECNGTTNNAERRRQVAFSTTIAITQTQLLTRKNSGVNSMKDLDGKTVVVTAGSTSERYMRNYVQQNNLKVNVVSARDHSQSFIMLQTNRAAAFFMDRDVLYALLSKAKDAKEYHLAGEPQSQEALACMMRKDDPQFKKLVDKTITDLHTSGKTEALYKKWFLAPIPPDNTVLGTPMSDSMKQLMAAPNDKSFDE